MFRVYHMNVSEINFRPLLHEQPENLGRNCNLGLTVLTALEFPVRRIIFTNNLSFY
jgi:hypothetical protein